MNNGADPMDGGVADSNMWFATKSMGGFVSMFITKWSVSTPQAPNTYKRKAKPAYAAYTSAEVATHSTPEDAWIIIHGKIYDISSWGSLHPGGDIFYSYAGRDATEPFAAMHKNTSVVEKVMKSFLIGQVSTADTPKIIEDFRKLRDQFAKEGLMDASPTYYTRKICELLLMVSTSLYLLWSGRAEASVFWLLVSSMLMATFVFQCGWTSHDFLHNQVFKACWWNTLVGGLIANVGIGGSTHWWKNKHNQHHATPNKMSADNTKALDPDIDTVPLVSWSHDLTKQVPASERWLIRVQHILVWPLLAVAYINWVIQGKIHLLSFPSIPTKQRKVELAAIVFHHLWLNVSIFACLSLPHALTFWVISHCVSGFGTAFVFIQSHNGMEIYEDDKDFVTSQIVSTRNINPGVVSDWVMGGLNYQIEHHLFPTMPRHSYSRIRTRIMEFCQRNELPYESCSVAESTYKVYSQLASIAKGV